MRLSGLRGLDNFGRVFNLCDFRSAFLLMANSMLRKCLNWSLPQFSRGKICNVLILLAVYLYLFQADIADSSHLVVVNVHDDSNLEKVSGCKVKGILTPDILLYEVRFINGHLLFEKD